MMMMMIMMMIMMMMMMMRCERRLWPLFEEPFYCSTSVQWKAVVITKTQTVLITGTPSQGVLCTFCF